MDISVHHSRECISPFYYHVFITYVWWIFLFTTAGNAFLRFTIMSLLLTFGGYFCSPQQGMHFSVLLSCLYYLRLVNISVYHSRERISPFYYHVLITHVCWIFLYERCRYLFTTAGNVFLRFTIMSLLLTFVGYFCIFLSCQYHFYVCQIFSVTIIFQVGHKLVFLFIRCFHFIQFITLIFV